MKNRLASPAVIGLALLSSATTALAAAEPPRPNVVLIMADDQGWGETGYNGHPHVKTPVLDELARTALRFDRFYAASPVCSPTRASILTGRHANRSGAFAPNFSTRPEEITLAQILRQAGYRTGHFGKWHVGAVKKESPVNPGRMGFDEYLSHDNFFELDPPFSRNGAVPEIIKGESSAIIVTEGAKFARQALADKKPFFLVLWFGSPHSPYFGTPQDVALYGTVASKSMKQRFAEITAMDRAIGEFRQALRAMGAAENTLLWFNSDNGIPIEREKEPEAFNGDWRGIKSSLYEGGIRVPAIIEWPAVIRHPRATSVPCVTTDIFATVLDVLHLQSPDPKRPLDGISLRRLIVDDTMKERPTPIGFWRYPAGQERNNAPWIAPELSQGTTPTTRSAAQARKTFIAFQNYRHPVAKTGNFGGEAAWTDNRYKLFVGDPATGGHAELYDVPADPKERHDLAAQHPDLVKRMTADLEAWQRSVERSLSGADY